MFCLILCHEKRWTTCDFTSLQQYDTEYQDTGRVIMTVNVQWNHIFGKDFCLLRESRPARSTDLR